MSTNSARGRGEESMSSDELIQGHLVLWHHALGYIKSAALRCAMELGIPDAIVRCGGSATLDELVAATKLPPSNLPFLRRLMRALTVSGIFSVCHRVPEGQGEGEGTITVDEPAASIPVYEVTAASRLLVTGVEGGTSPSLFPTIKPLVNPEHVSAILGMHEWMKHESASTMSIFTMAGSKDLWQVIEANPMVRAGFYQAMDSDTRVIMHAVLRDHAAIFEGITSLVDVGGGRGTAAAAIAMVFPDIKCTVMDLPHVVAEATNGGIVNGVTFVGGDMFEHIPPADAVLLKWVLHDWDDDHCIKILRQCKEAIAHGNSNRKVVIIDAIIGSKANDAVCTEAQVLCDLYFMSTVNGGTEREEHEWRRIFVEAGFSDYRITSIHGIPSVIELYS